MGFRCDYTVTCEGCAKTRKYTENVISNKPSKLSFTYDPTGAVMHREEYFYAFGFAWHICGACANALVRGGLKALQEIIAARTPND